jgi:uncharacterized linocin/CFP29 family protein
MIRHLSIVNYLVILRDEYIRSYEDERSEIFQQLIGINLFIRHPFGGGYQVLKIGTSMEVKAGLLNIVSINRQLFSPVPTHVQPAHY